MKSRIFAEELPESVIKRLSIEVDRVGGINLGQGIPSFPTADRVLQAAREALADPKIGVYPNFLGQIELRQALSYRFNKRYSLRLDPEQHILITVGAMEATASAILSLVSSGDRVGVITPDYCNHFPQVQLAKGRIVELPLDEDADWGLDLTRIQREAKRGLALLVFTNPNNPTGAVFDQEEVGGLVKLANRYGFYVLADETYAFLSYGKRPASLLEFWQASDRLLTVRTFSKEYAMTGWRVGYVIANADLTAALAKTHDALVGTAAKISQRAALAALRGDQEEISRQVEVYRERRDLVFSFLGKAPSLSAVEPMGSYYVFVRYPQRFAATSRILADEILERAKVAVVPGSVFGSVGEGHIRISFCGETSDLRLGMRRLVRYFNR